jgi:hypothetical protein
MDHTAEVVAPCRPAELFVWVDDLSRYPDWHGIVERAEPAPGEPGDLGPAWTVDLAARVGPFSRAKRLRMVRTEHEPGRRASFARREVDGRDHGTWRLTASVEPLDGDAGSRLTMHLHYGGRLWGPILEPILNDAIDGSRRRLLELVASRAS